MTVTPAYGRDYPSADAAERAWRAGVDFILHDLSSPWDGKPLSMRDVPHGARVQIRYAARRRAVVITNERNQ